MSGSIQRFSSFRGVREEDKFKRIQAHETFVECCSVSPDGKLLATCSGDETVKLWNAKDFSHVSTFHGHYGPVWNCDFNCRSTKLCSCSSDQTVRVWDISKEKELISMKKHENTVWACKFCPPSSKTIASCSSDTKIIIWNYVRDVVLQILEDHLNVVEDISFSLFSYNLLASCSLDKTIRIWKNYRSGRLKKPLVLKGHMKRVTSCAFSPINNEILVSSSADLTLRIWNIKQGIQLKVLCGHSNIVWKCAFLVYRDYLFLATCSSDRSLRFWDPVSGCELKKFVNLDSSQDPRAQLLCFTFFAKAGESQGTLAVVSYEGGLYIAKIGDLLDNLLDEEECVC